MDVVTQDEVAYLHEQRGDLETARAIRSRLQARDEAELDLAAALLLLAGAGEVGVEIDLREAA